MTNGQWVGESTPYLTPNGDTWGDEAAAQDRAGSQRIAFTGEATPPQFVSDRLATASGESTILRRRLILLDDCPIEIADSYWPASLAAGTPLAEPGKIRGGAVALLADMGHSPAAVEEEISSRPASEEERRIFTLDESEWVLVLARTIADRTGRVYEVSLMTTPGRARRLKYAMRVS